MDIIMSVIIVVHRNFELLCQTLKSLIINNDLGDSLEIIIIDNSDVSEEIQKSIKSINYEILYKKVENRGFGAGNNEGSRMARGKYLAFINPDMIFIEKVFSDIVNVFENDINIEMIGCKLLNEERKDNYSFFYDYDSSFAERLYAKFCHTIDWFDNRRLFTSGSNLFVKKSSFIESGCFDENIFMYYEEPDLKRRIASINKNAKFIYKSNLRIIHLEGRDSSDKINKYLVDSIVYYGKKYNLNYKKKMKFEYKYRKLKYYICRVLNIEYDKCNYEVFKKYIDRIV